MEIVGKITQVLPMQTGTSQRTGNPWAIQSFILETQDQFPRKVCIEMFGEERIKTNPIAENEIVTVSFDLESREFNGRWYTSVRAWRVQQGAVAAPAAAPVAAAAQPAAQAQTQAAAAPASQPAAAPTTAATFDGAADDGSDLPF